MTINAATPPMPDGQMVPLDDLDRQIVAALRADGRLSMRALASELHISRANAYARVDRLERSGVITGYSAICGSDNQLRVRDFKPAELKA